MKRGSICVHGEGTGIESVGEVYLFNMNGVLVERVGDFTPLDPGDFVGDFVSVVGRDRKSVV